MKNWKTWLFVIALFLMIRQCGGCVGCSSSKDRMIEEAYKAGKNNALNYPGVFYYATPSDDCERHFIDTWGYPETEEDLELYKEYKEEYYRGWEDGKKIRIAM